LKSCLLLDHVPVHETHSTKVEKQRNNIKDSIAEPHGQPDA